MSVYHPLPTVRVVNPHAPAGFMIINASDLRDDHELWSDEPVEASGEPTGNHLPGDRMRIGKGPRGKWYVWLDREKVEGPFDTEADAETALNSKNGG